MKNKLVLCVGVVTFLVLTLNLVNSELSSCEYGCSEKIYTDENGETHYECNCNWTDEEKLGRALCNGCYVHRKCYNYGDRMGASDYYCNDDAGMIPQRTTGDPCKNDFQCQSNECFEGKCSPEEKVENKVIEEPNKQILENQTKETIQTSENISQNQMQQENKKESWFIRFIKALFS